MFACIIAQQFSNLRRGDRFWYENGDSESSFTPAQLQSIRQVNLAQVICRAIGSGTLQSHAFLPHTVPTNERVQCGTGSLTPIDLKPWLERDPFLKNTHSPNDSTVKSHDGRPSSQTPPLTQTIKTNDKIIIKLDLPPSENPIDIQIQHEPLSVNGTIINNKLDLDTIRSHFNSNRQQNKITNKQNTITKTQPTRTQNKKHKTTTTVKPTTNSNTNTNTNTTKRTKKRKNKNHNRRKHKRDVSNQTDEKARSSIVIKIDKPTDDETSTQKTPFNGSSSKRRIDKDNSDKIPDKEYVIVTQDQNLYDIEIKIKPKQPQQAQSQEKIIVQTNSNVRPTNAYDSYYDNSKTSTKRPQQFYEIAQPSLDVGHYNVYDEPIKPQQPTYNFDTYRPQNVFVKRTTTTTTTTTTSTTRRPYIYNVQQDQQTSRPYYPTKRPTHSYGSNEPESQNDDKPFYSFPTVQNTDTSSYYSPSSTNHNDEFVTVIENSKPYQIKPQYDSYYLNRPTGANGPSTFNDNYGGQYDDEKPIYAQNIRPPQNDYQNSDYGPTYLDDFTTKRPTKLTTTFVVHDDDDYFDSVQNGYGSVTTNRPHDLTTFYTVQTTRKKKQTTRRPTARPTRPTRPIVYNQNDDEDDDNDNNDDDDDDESVNTGYFNPSSVLSNIVNTFNGYFGSPSTTTRKPYITQQDENFYTYPSIPGDFPYSRQKNIDTIQKSDKPHHKRNARIKRDLSDDYEQTTYPAALNVDFNNDDIVDDTKDIAFDRDGYLRPEYMKYDSHKTAHNSKLHIDVNSNIDMKDMHPTLTHAMTNATDKLQQQQPPPPQYYRIDHLPNGHFENDRHHKQITTLTDANRNKGQSVVRFKAIPTNRPFGLVPLNVLTKPER